MAAKKISKGKDDPRLLRFTKICLSLPEVEWEYTGQHGIYRVGKKIFAYYLDDHHGDGMVAMSCKAPPGENQALVRKDPARYFFPAYNGPRGWMAARLDMGRVDWDDIAGFAARAYILTAPKKLAAKVVG